LTNVTLNSVLHMNLLYSRLCHILGALTLYSILQI